MTSSPLPAVAFIGLGDQGLPMATAIAEAGHPLHAWARRPQSLDGLDGVHYVRHEHLAELGAASNIVCLCVSTDADVLNVLTGELLANLRPGSIVINHGTGTPQQAILFAEVCAAADIEFSDAHVSGGHAGAVAKTLTTMVGGPKAAAHTCEPVFATFSTSPDQQDIGADMALTIDRLTDRARQDQLESMEREYFDWVNSELGSEFGIALDTDAMIAHDLAELDIYLPPDGAVLLASDDGQLAGMVFLTRLRPDAAQIRRMYVRPAYRRNGLGGALFGYAVELARTIGYSRLLLESPRSWDGAHAVYTRHGFTPVDAYPESEVPPELTQYWIHMGRDL